MTMIRQLLISGATGYTCSVDVELPLAEQVCLALVAEGVEHGWALGTLLSPDGELGRIWSLTRPLTYRAIDRLVERGLVVRSGTGTGRSRERNLLAVSPAGRAATDAWLDEPVEHLRDVRTELLLKLALRARTGRPAEPLLVAQRARFDTVIDRLVAAPAADPVAQWRAESARAVRRFLDRAVGPKVATPEGELQVSARNQLRATIVSIGPGDVLVSVKVRLPDGQTLTSVVTREAVEALDLAVGDEVVALVKSTEVMLGRIRR